MLCMEKQCEAYTTKGVPLARGGTRYSQCRRKATTIREHTRHGGVAGWTDTRPVHVCGTHAAMLDRGDTGCMHGSSR